VRWDEAAHRWQVAAADGVLSAQYLIAGVEPSLPDIPGIGSFAGAIMHTARWDAGWSPTGRRVAVIGTGASAIQVVPSIQPQVEHLTVFQRTAAFVVPHTGRPVKRWRRAAYRYVPWTQRASRLTAYWMRELMVFGFVRKPEILKKAEAVWKRHMERAVGDPVKRKQLTHRRAWLPQLLPPDRRQHRARALLHGVDDREPAGLRRGFRAPHRGVGRRARRGQAAGGRGLQRRAAGQAARHGLGFRLLQLVPEQRGPQPDALAGLHLRFPAADPPLPANDRVRQANRD
jgi:cation diffusion facilitator CzcD-associated flavoprotein CzcO